MELQVGEYILPEDCTFVRKQRVIKVFKKKRNTLNDKEYRCMNCVHYVTGHSVLRDQTTKVCDLKPKKLRDPEGTRNLRYGKYKDYKIYYAAKQYDHPCDKFELRKES